MRQPARISPHWPWRKRFLFCRNAFLCSFVVVDAWTRHEPDSQQIRQVLVSFSLPPG